MSSVDDYIDFLNKEYEVLGTGERIVLIKDELRVTVNTNGYVIFETFMNRKPYWFKSITAIHSNVAADLSKGTARMINVPHLESFRTGKSYVATA